MGLFDLFKRHKTEKIDRFTKVSADDNMLLPQQVQSLPPMIKQVRGEILYIQDTSDEMLPECSFFMPNLLAEFRENPNLAMIHGLGTVHAWIRVSMLKEVLETSPSGLRDYKDLFMAFTRLGYSVRKIKYISFRSSLKNIKARGDREGGTRRKAVPTPEEVMQKTGMSEDELTRRFLEHLIQSGKNPFMDMPEQVRLQVEEKFPDLLDLTRKKFGKNR